MHLTLTDVLTCPRCGPEHGLIALSERMEQRRILEGRLGCPNCRRHYPIEQGLADLRTGVPAAREAGGEAAEVKTLIALMGVTEPGGYALVAGPIARQAALLLEALPSPIELILVNDNVGEFDEAPGLNRLLVDRDLPLRNAAVRGAILDGWAAELWLEAARALRPGSRLVVSGAAVDAQQAIRAGVPVLAEAGGITVLQRPG